MTININIANKRPTVVGTPVIVCGNSDYTIVFTFDNEWSGATLKTARFVYTKAGAVEHKDVPFSGNVVAVPVLSEIREVYVGVYAGDLQTTTPARIPCERSILCGSGEHEDPEPDVYAQILAVCNALATAAAKATHYNLLDNSDFRNPVNQRGQTIYTDANATIDRWGVTADGAGAYCALTVNNGSVTFNSSDAGLCYLYQRFPVGILSANKPYTIAVGFADGSIQIQYTGITHNADFSQVVLNIQNNSALLWAALYEGEYTAATLPEYQPKGYAAELAECQRYFITVDGVGVGYAHPYETTGAYGFIPLPAKMRILQPTVTCATMSVGTTGYADSFAWANGISQVYATQTGLQFWLSGNYMTVGQVNILNVVNMQISADL